MRAIHHTAIITADIDLSLRFWRDGLGLAQFLDSTFRGDWPTLFGADTDVLKSIFLGDPDHPESGIVELVQFAGGQNRPEHPRRDEKPPAGGFFLVSMERDVDTTLPALEALGFSDGVRRISVPAPGGKRVEMAVINAPDGVLVELIGPAA